MRRVVLALAALACAAPAAAQAWTVAPPLAGAAGYAPQAVFEPSGAGLLLWDNGTGSEDAPIVGDVPGAVATLAGAPAELTETGALAPLPTDDPSAFTVLAVSDLPRSPPLARATYLNIAGRVRSSGPIVRRPHGLSLLAGAGLASNDRGTAATLLTRCLDAGCSRRQILLALEGAESAFVAPIVLATIHGASAGGAVSVNGNGDVLAAWQGQGAVYAREYRASQRLTPLQRLGPTAPTRRSLITLATLGAVLSYSGRGVVAWTSEGAGAGTPTPHTPATVRAAGSDVHGHFGAARRIDRFDFEHEGFELAAGALQLRAAGGTNLLVWQGRAGGHFAVRAATLAGDGAASHVRTISAAGGDAYLDDLTVGPHRQALALWSTEPPLRGGPDVDHARLWAASTSAGAFGAPAAVTATPGPVVRPSLAVDPHSGVAFATWEGPLSGQYPQVETASGAL